MSDFKPYPKAQQLSRGSRRHWRKVASPKRWQAIIDAKVGPCRVCTDPASNGSKFGRVQFHHLIPRSLGGDDAPDNIVPLCPVCHELVTRRGSIACGLLCSSLTDSECAYCVTKFGEGVFERVYGIEYER